jgi:hypothetical protein
MAYKPTRRSRTTKEGKPTPPSQHQIEREVRRLKRLPLTGGPADAIVNVALETLLWAQGAAVDPPADNVKTLLERWSTELADRAGASRAD